MNDDPHKHYWVEVAFADYCGDADPDGTQTTEPHWVRTSLVRLSSTMAQALDDGDDETFTVLAEHVREQLQEHLKDCPQLDRDNFRLVPAILQ